MFLDVLFKIMKSQKPSKYSSKNDDEHQDTSVQKTLTQQLKTYPVRKKANNIKGINKKLSLFNFFISVMLLYS